MAVLAERTRCIVAQRRWHNAALHSHPCLVDLTANVGPHCSWNTWLAMMLPAGTCFWRSMHSKSAAFWASAP